MARYCLMKRLAGHLDCFFYEVARIKVIVERAAGDLGQLPIMAISKNGEVLSSRPKVWRQSTAGEGVSNRIRSKARNALFAICDNRRSGRFEALERIGDGSVLLLLKLSLVIFLAS